MTDRKGVLPSHYESKLVTSACSGVSLVPSAWFRYSTLERAKAIIHSRWRASNLSLQRENTPRNTLSRTPSLPDGSATTIQRNGFAAEARRTAWRPGPHPVGPATIGLPSRGRPEARRLGARCRGIGRQFGRPRGRFRRAPGCLPRVQCRGGRPGIRKPVLRHDCTRP